MNTLGLLAIAAGIAALICGVAAVSMSLATKKAVESIARQPEAAGQIRSAMILALGLMEALTIYGLLIAFMLIGKI